jgi:hypothetical protein
VAAAAAVQVFMAHRMETGFLDLPIPEGVVAEEQTVLLEQAAAAL